MSNADLPGLLERLRSVSLPVVSVGDTTTLNLINGGVIPDLAIIDLCTRRGRLEAGDMDDLEQFIAHGKVLDIRNPREHITVSLWESIHRFYLDFYDPQERISVTACENEVYEGTAANGGDAGKNPWRQNTPGHNKFKIGRPGRMGTTPLIIRIEGEEDLASLPCVYFAGKGGHVLYGLPDKGLIHIQVEETHRTNVRDALIKMEALYEPHDNQSD